MGVRSHAASRDAEGPGHLAHAQVAAGTEAQRLGRHEAPGASRSALPQRVMAFPPVVVHSLPGMGVSKTASATPNLN